MIQAADFAKKLQLMELSPSTKTEWDIRTADLNRPGMQFCGFYEYFAFERPQVIGKVEMTYLESLEPEARRQMLKKYFSYDLPCVIICRGMTPPDDLLQAAAARDIAVYQTNMVTTKFTFTAINYLNRCLAPAGNPAWRAGGCIRRGRTADRRKRRGQKRGCAGAGQARPSAGGG